jgi:sugar phosphate isomerase/epimerase
MNTKYRGVTVWFAVWLSRRRRDWQRANRVENHARIEDGFRKNIPLAAKAGVPNVITFSGNRAGMSDETGAKNTIAGLNRMKKMAEDHGVTICMELLNSKVNQGLPVRSHGMGSAGGASGELAARQTAV